MSVSRNVTGYTNVPAVNQSLTGTRTSRLEKVMMPAMAIEDMSMRSDVTVV